MGRGPTPLGSPRPGDCRREGTLGGVSREREIGATTLVRTFKRSFLAGLGPPPPGQPKTPEREATRVRGISVCFRCVSRSGFSRGFLSGILPKYVWGSPEAFLGVLPGSGGSPEVFGGFSRGFSKGSPAQTHGLSSRGGRPDTRPDTHGLSSRGGRPDTRIQFESNAREHRIQFASRGREHNI